MSFPELTVEQFNVLRNTDASAVFTVTPEIANYLLDNHNANNRRSLTTQRVKLYVEYMNSGAWNYRISAIHVGADGNIDNGQHRLSAAVKAGPVPMRFEFGMPAEAADYYDQARASRSAADNLARFGILTKGAATVLGMYVSYLQGGTGRHTVPVTEYRDTLEKYPEFSKHLTTAAEIVRKYDANLTGPATRYMAVVAILMAVGHNPDRIEEFIKGLIPAPTMTPSLYWAECSLRDVSYGQSGNRQAMHFLLHAFNKWARGDNAARRFPSDIQVPLSKLVKPVS